MHELNLPLSLYGHSWSIGYEKEYGGSVVRLIDLFGPYCFQCPTQIRIIVLAKFFEVVEVEIAPEAEAHNHVAVSIEEFATAGLVFRIRSVGGYSNVQLLSLIVAVFGTGNQLNRAFAMVADIHRNGVFKAHTGRR